MKIIHLSDVHLTGDGTDLFCGNPQDRFDTCIAHANARHGDADLCVITGDLTHHGEEEAYVRFKASVEQLVMPTELLLGNHDDRQAFKKHFPERRTSAGGFVQTAFGLGDHRIVLMDTNEPGTHAGHYCERRLTWLENTLIGGRGQPTLVFMHHHPMPVGVAAMDRIGQRDGKALRALLARHSPSIRHMFFGHCHLPMSGSWRGIPFSSIKSLNHPLLPEYDEPTISIADTPPHYAVAFVTAESVVIHHEEFLFDGKRWDGIGTTVAAWSGTQTASK